MPMYWTDNGRITIDSARADNEGNRVKVNDHFRFDDGREYAITSVLPPLLQAVPIRGVDARPRGFHYTRCSRPDGWRQQRPTTRALYWRENGEPSQFERDDPGAPPRPRVQRGEKVTIEGGDTTVIWEIVDVRSDCRIVLTPVVGTGTHTTNYGSVRKYTEPKVEQQTEQDILQSLGEHVGAIAMFTFSPERVSLTAGTVAVGCQQVAMHHIIRWGGSIVASSDHRSATIHVPGVIRRDSVRFGDTETNRTQPFMEVRRYASKAVLITSAPQVEKVSCRPGTFECTTHRNHSFVLSTYEGSPRIIRSDEPETPYVSWAQWPDCNPSHLVYFDGPSITTECTATQFEGCDRV